MEQSNNIEKNLFPVRLSGRNIYRCPFCRKKFDAKTKAMDHIRSVHLQLKKFCNNCERNVSFVAYKRHLRICVTRENSTKTNHINRSCSQTNLRDIQQRQNAIVDGSALDEVEKSPLQSPVYAENENYVSPNNRHIAEVLPKLNSQTKQNAAVNQITHLWTYERPTEDELDIFGKFVAVELRALARNDQFSLKKRIQQLLLEYEPADKNTEPIEDFANITVRTEVEEREIKPLSSETATIIDDDDDEFQSLLTPKRESIERENILKSVRCSFCDCDSDFFHDNLNEIKTKYSNKQILNTFEGWGSHVVFPKATENCVCCDECFCKIIMYDLERVTLDKTMQTDLLAIDHDQF